MTVWKGEEHGKWKLFLHGGQDSWVSQDLDLATG